MAAVPPEVPPLIQPTVTIRVQARPLAEALRILARAAEEMSCSLTDAAKDLEQLDAEVADPHEDEEG
jgi:exoribonuclease R